MSRYNDATALLLSGVPLTGTQKRKANRDREIHYVSRRQPIDGRIKLQRKIRSLPLAKLFQMIRRAVNAQRKIVQAKAKISLPSLDAKFAALDEYRRIVGQEIQRRKTPKCNAH